MSKINELNRDFKEKSFFTTAESYNDLLGYARGLAGMIDSKIARISHLEEDIKSIKNRYIGALRRDPKTGRYLKRKK